MVSLIPVGVAGLGRYVPERRLTNQELEKLVDTSDEWIVQRTGIRERRIAAPDQVTSTMALLAAKDALADAKMSPEELDLVICATVTGDQSFSVSDPRAEMSSMAVTASSHTAPSGVTTGRVDRNRSLPGISTFTKTLTSR